MLVTCGTSPQLCASYMVKNGCAVVSVSKDQIGKNSIPVAEPTASTRKQRRIVLAIFGAFASASSGSQHGR